MHEKILFLPLIKILKTCADSLKIQGTAVNIGIKKHWSIPEIPETTMQQQQQKILQTE